MASKGVKIYIAEEKSRKTINTNERKEKDYNRHQEGISIRGDI